MHFLLNHPELQQDMIHTLKARQHDSEENVRYEVVMAIVSTGMITNSFCTKRVTTLLKIICKMQGKFWSRSQTS